ncbi:GNAT family N-acetyltransferase [Jiulongibacter sediminis]|uniref:GNAT family acetyltransferase n=1 Tax=Jiulongibacter sediminis TaxID=1605367 RepID=A0A0P7BTU0_9BACT|nr:GNAT family N-acetyltransferase [Jiulongibacter sediminis]KPM48063.1 GNAT family acetyltransferase [Jiulongibacter sediminis]TBX24244.1 GNAT family acetyltransferase [Jiulongibacter sediminis]
MEILRTDSENPDFQKLVSQLDAELAVIDGDDHDFYHQYNGITMIKHAVVIFHNGQPIGCGAIKEYDAESMEVKRMYVSPEGRSKGTGTIILKELETWTLELGYRKCILETGKRQQDAVTLYTKNGYELIPNYGQYAEVENSVCFEKYLF